MRAHALVSSAGHRRAQNSSAELTRDPRSRENLISSALSAPRRESNGLRDPRTISVAQQSSIRSAYSSSRLLPLLLPLLFKSGYSPQVLARSRRRPDAGDQQADHRGSPFEMRAPRASSRRRPRGTLSEVSMSRARAPRSPQQQRSCTLGIGHRRNAIDVINARDTAWVES